jgi:type IV pilus assembly protein PilV
MKTTMHFSPSSRASQKSQSGVILIEALVAILIFTIGVIALMGVQAAAMRSTSDSKIRMDAEFFVDQLFSEMVIDSRGAGGIIDFARLSTRYDSTQNGPGFQRWRNRVRDVANGGLPGVTTAAMEPVVTVTNLPTLGGVTMVGVTVLVQWRGPNDLQTAPSRRVVSSTLINQ